jgi:predicted XRE-type DNA-binding protein
MPDVPSPDEVLRQLKQQVAAGIIARLAGWTQGYAADFIGTWQPRMSALRNNRLESFSLDQLLRYVTHLDVIVRLEIEWLDNRRYLFKTLPPTRIEVRCNRPGFRRPY